jgi:hypothetical protein
MIFAPDDEAVTCLVDIQVQKPSLGSGFTGHRRLLTFWYILLAWTHRADLRQRPSIRQSIQRQLSKLIGQPWRQTILASFTFYK